MTSPALDERSPERRQRDEQLAREPQLAPLDLPANAPSSPVEAQLASHVHRPVAITGMVENGLVRPLDPTIELPENARVIIVASEEK